MKLNKVIEVLESNNSNSQTLVTIPNYTNRNGETSSYVVNVNVDYNKLKDRDVKLLKSLKFEGVKEVARLELLDSFKKNSKDLTRTNQSKGQIETYQHLSNNVKQHKSTGEVYVSGYVIEKVVHKVGVYKSVNSSSKTIAKNEIKKLLRSSNYRTLATGVYL